MRIRLVCLDFDGTAVEYGEQTVFFHPAVIETLNNLAEPGVEWCTNSGRSKEDQERILWASKDRGLRHMPAAILAGEAFIFDRHADAGYLPREPWNSKTLAQLSAFHARVQTLLQDRLSSWRTDYDADIRLGPDHTVFCIPGEEARVEDFCAKLTDCLRSVTPLTITRNGGWVVILPEEMGKGNILNHYRQQRGFGRDEVMAVGDNLNDISMLNGGPARWVGCPSDAKAEVLETVRAAQGWVATEPGAKGTAQILNELRRLLK